MLTANRKPFNRVMRVMDEVLADTEKHLPEFRIVGVSVIQTSTGRLLEVSAKGACYMYISVTAKWGGVAFVTVSVSPIGNDKSNGWKSNKYASHADVLKIIDVMLLASISDEDAMKLEAFAGELVPPELPFEVDKITYRFTRKALEELRGGGGETSARIELPY